MVNRRVGFLERVSEDIGRDRQAVSELTPQRKPYFWENLPEEPDWFGGEQDFGASDAVTAPTPPPPEISPLDEALLKQEEGVQLEDDELQLLENYKWWGDQPLPPAAIRKPITEISRGAQEALESPIGQAVTLGVGIGAIVVGIGIPAAQQSWRSLTNLALMRQISRYATERNIAVSKEEAQVFANTLRATAQQKGFKWNLDKSVLRDLFKSTSGRTVPTQEATQQAEDLAMRVVNQYAPTIIPRGTQTGAMAFGGKRFEGKVPKPPPLTVKPEGEPVAPEIARPPVLPQVGREEPTGTFARTLRDIGDIVQPQENFTEAGNLKPQARTQLVKDVTGALDNNILSIEEAGGILSEYINHPLLNQGNFEGFIAYWKGKPLASLSSKPATPMSESDINELVSTIAKPVAPEGEVAPTVVEKSLGEASASDVIADIKAKGFTKQTGYGQFVIARSLKPEIDMKEFSSIFDSVAPKLFQATTITGKITPTHIVTETYEGAFPKRVQILEEGEGYTKWITEEGSVQSSPKKFIKSMETIQPVTPTPKEAVTPTTEAKVGAGEVTPPVKAPVVEAKAQPEIPSEEQAVIEVAGAPPKPPKDWDKIGKQLYDKFNQQAPQTSPSTVPLSDRLKRAYVKAQKFSTDELAGLNSLGWQAELDSAMVRAASGQSSELYRETVDNIRKSLDNDSNLINSVDKYLMLRHQLEVLKATGRKYFIIKKGTVSQRFTANQIGLLFAQMKKELGAENYAKIKEAASHVPAVYNQILRETEELTPGQIEGLIKKYPWFNPIIFQKESSPVNISGKMSARQIRQLTTLESDKELISPLLSLPSTIAKRIQAQAINRARKSVADLAVDPKNDVLVGGKAEIVIEKPEGTFIDYFDGGQRKYLKLSEGAEWLAKDIELLQRQPANALIRNVRALQNLSKMAFTTYNPGFMAWNTVFDGAVAYFAEGITPLQFGKAYAENIKGMFADVPGLNEFRRSGGEVMGFFGKAELGEGVKGYISKKEGRLVLENPNSLKRFLNPFELIRELGLAGENAARKAVYDKAIREGVSPKEAAIRGLRVTVDFGRFSQASRHINDWYLYFNPALQGLLLPGRAIKKDPQSIWRLGVLVAAYAGLVAYNQSYDEYDDVRNSDKVGKLLIMLPSNEYDKYGNKVPHYLTVAPLREFALFTAPIEYFMGRMRTEEPEAYRSLSQEFGYVYPVISPLSMISESGGVVVPTQVGSTWQQIASNHDDFRNKPIVDDEMELLPASQQYDQYTNKMAIRIGQALNISPKKIDFGVSNMFGAIGSDLLRTVDLAIQQIDNEQVDFRIASMVNELRSIPTKVPPNQIELTRETFLEGLSVEDREVVLNMERMPDDKIPFFQSLFRRFFRDYGGQVYATAKEKALGERTLKDYPPEALEELQKTANENANNLLNDKVSKYQYDQNRSRYRAYYSGARTAEWREAMVEGAVSSAEVDKHMPEAYRRSEQFQAVSSYMDIQQESIEDAGGVLDSDTWAEIEEQTVSELKRLYSDEAVQYAILHKDDWIDNLPEPARTVERNRANEIDDGTWWDDYRGDTSGGSLFPKSRNVGGSRIPTTTPSGEGRKYFWDR